MLGKSASGSQDFLAEGGGRVITLDRKVEWLRIAAERSEKVVQDRSKNVE